MEVWHDAQECCGCALGQVCGQTVEILQPTQKENMSWTKKILGSSVLQPCDLHKLKQSISRPSNYEEKSRVWDERNKTKAVWRNWDSWVMASINQMSKDHHWFMGIFKYPERERATGKRLVWTLFFNLVASGVSEHFPESFTHHSGGRQHL